MEKNELFDIIIKKANVTKQELEQQYIKEYEDLKKRSIPEKDIDKFVISRIKTLYKKQFLSKAEKFEGVIIGITQPSDFGAKRKYDLATKQWNEAQSELRNVLIKEGFFDSEGNPLWVVDNFKKGRKIVPSEEIQQNLILLVKNEVVNDFKLAYLTLRKNKIGIKKPMFKPIIFRANLRKEENDVLYLNQASVTEFIETDTKIDVVELIKIHLKDKLVKGLNSLREYHTKTVQDNNRIAVFKANIASINLDLPNTTIISVDDENFGIEEEITCFLPKEINVDFEEGAQNCIFLGKTQTRIDFKTQQEKFVVNLYGIIVDDIWKRKVTNEIKPEEIIEEEVF